MTPEAFRALRVNLGLTVGQLAAALGVGERHAYRMLSGATSISTPVARQIRMFSAARRGDMAALELMTTGWIEGEE